MLGYCSHGLCILPNMVVNAKIMRKSTKSQEKRRNMMCTCWSCWGTVCVHGLCAFLNMVIDVNIFRKSEKIRKKWRDRWRSLSTMLVHCLYGICTFPNMVINRTIIRQSEKLGKKEDCCQQCWGTVYMVCAHFLIW